MLTFGLFVHAPDLIVLDGKDNKAARVAAQERLVLNVLWIGRKNVDMRQGCTARGESSVASRLLFGLDDTCRPDQAEWRPLRRVTASDLPDSACLSSPPLSSTPFSPPAAHAGLPVMAPLRNAKHTDLRREESALVRVERLLGANLHLRHALREILARLAH